MPSNPEYKVIHQLFELSIGYVFGPVFYRLKGAGVHVGVNGPLLYLVAQRPAKRLGRPTDAPKRKRLSDATHSAYAMDGRGYWWSVRYTVGGEARARTLSKPPYAALGRRRFGWGPDIRAEAQRVLREAAIAACPARPDCDLI